jgi:hypothetical protein
MRPPRGYVEPDPATFEAIAGLFDTASEVAGRVLSDAELLAGVRRRLAESAAKSRALAAMARKEQRGETLSPAEYEEILYFARVAEHHFLLYKALANPTSEYAITAPEPMPKIADVAGGGPEGLLLSAVGRPLEWVQTVPYFGRRELVKGAVYSYYELQSPEPLDDTEWRKLLPQTTPPAWIQPWMGPAQPAP